MLPNCFTCFLINFHKCLFSPAQVIVHTAVRTKVPFKKKVQGERSSKATKSKSNHHSAAKNVIATATSAGVVSTTADATNATGSAPTKVFKRVVKTASPKKNVKKKKRVAAAVGDEEQNKQNLTADVVPVKMKKQKKSSSKSKHKEVINYTNRSATENHTNTFGKVQKWLLESPIVSHPPTNSTTVVDPMPATAAAAGATTATAHASSTKIRKLMSKSQSTPERLAQRSPKKIKSVGNLNDKVKLQVVYKPPFKFSLKLSKNSAVKTKVIGGGIGGRNKRKLRAVPENNVTDTIANSNSRRMALLIRTAATENLPAAAGTPAATTSAAAFSVAASKDVLNSSFVRDEPTYETLNTKKMDTPVYENVTVGSALASDHLDEPLPPPINTATFRIHRSVSGSNVIKPQISSTNSNSNSRPVSNTEHRGSTTNLSISGSGGSVTGSTQNLMRSSTTNLSKNNNRNSLDMKRGTFDLSRSSTTNLSKDKRYSSHHGSHANLTKHKRGGSNSNVSVVDESMSAIGQHQQPVTGRSRKNSGTNLKSTDSSSKSNIPRIPSNSNLKIPSLRRGSISNIPRASLNANSFNQHGRFSAAPSGGISQPQSLSQPAPPSMKATSASMRPHTADCATSANTKRFEWPSVLTNAKTAKDDPLPSDLEVMVSDVENLVNDV